MHEAPTFTRGEVEQRLHDLGIAFSAHGEAKAKRYAFKSLQQIEPAGIYFLAPGIVSPPRIETSLILCSEGARGDAGNVTLTVADPQLAFYRLMEAMVGYGGKPGGVHPTAIVREDCEIDPSAYIGPYCVLEGCIVKAGVRLHSHVTVMSGTTIEEDVVIDTHATIGATGTAWTWDPAARRRVIQPQIGYTVLGRGCVLGSDITIVRGSVNDTTTIGEDCVISHGSIVGHGSRIGRGCHISNHNSINGNVTLGEECFLGSAVVIRPQTRLADRTVVGAGAVVVKTFDKPDLVLVGAPAKPTQSASAKLAGVPRPLGV